MARSSGVVPRLHQPEQPHLPGEIALLVVERGIQRPQPSRPVILTIDSTEGAGGFVLRQAGARAGVFVMQQLDRDGDLPCQLGQGESNDAGRHQDPAVAVLAAFVDPGDYSDALPDALARHLGQIRQIAESSNLRSSSSAMVEPYIHRG
jgi:hypothetical protein